MATILVVDDRPDNRELLVKMLGCSGHELRQAGDGAEALASTIRDRPDLVIADILMPGMDGYEFVRRLRANPTVGATPVIFFTAIYDRDEARFLARKFGVTHLLVKPIEPERMLRTVAEALGTGRGPGTVAPSREIDPDHLRLVNDTLADTVRELEARTGRLRALIDLGISLAQESNPGRMLSRCCRAGREMIGAHHAILGMLAEDRQAFGHVLTEGLDDADGARLGFPNFGEGLLGRVVAEGMPSRSATEGGEGRLPAIIPGHPPAGSFLGVPVATAGRLYGVLAFVDKLGGGPFDREDQGLAASLASQLAIAFEDAGRKAEIERHTRQLERYSERLAILRRIDQAVLSSYRPRDVAATALHHLRRLIDCWSIGLWVIDWEGQNVERLAEVGAGEALLPRRTKLPLASMGAEDLAAIRAARDCIVEDVARLAEPSQFVRILGAAGLRSYVRLPMAFEGQVIGSLVLASDRAGPFDAEQLEIARQVVDHLAIAIRQAMLFNQVRSGRERMRTLSRELLKAQEEDRRRIARELHDEIGQSLTAVRINVQRAMMSPDLGSTSSYLRESDGLIDHVLQQVRQISQDLRPSMLDDLGLVASVRWQLDRTARLAGFAGHFTANPPEIRLPPETETECFRIAQEALTNVMRHAGARQVDVALSRRGERLDLIVHDDGAGFDVAAAHRRAAHGRSLGLLGMQERAALLGGRITIEAGPGQGTKVHLRVPLAAHG